MTIHPALVALLISQGLMLTDGRAKLECGIFMAVANRWKQSTGARVSACFISSTKTSLSFVLFVCLGLFIYLHVYPCLPGCHMHESSCRRRNRMFSLWNWSTRWLWITWHCCWEQNSGPLQEQQVFYTTEPSLQCLDCSWGPERNASSKHSLFCFYQTETAGTQLKNISKHWQHKLRLKWTQTVRITLWEFFSV